MGDLNVPIYLKDIIAYVNGKKSKDKIELLRSVTVTAIMVANPIGATESTAFTLLGSNIPSG